MNLINELNDKHLGLSRSFIKKNPSGFFFWCLWLISMGIAIILVAWFLVTNITNPLLLWAIGIGLFSLIFIPLQSWSLTRMRNREQEQKLSDNGWRYVKEIMRENVDLGVKADAGFYARLHKKYVDAVHENWRRSKLRMELPDDVEEIPEELKRQDFEDVGIPRPTKSGFGL